MITIKQEPEGVLLQRADVFRWLEGLTVERWKKIRPTLRTHYLPGCSRPFYLKTDVRAKLVEPIRKQTNDE